MAIITTAGENLIAAQQAAGQNLVIDQIIFANISGLDHTATPSKNESKPGAGDIVAAENITQAGLVNESTVVYSMAMPSTMGTWSFNWMGLYSSAHDVVVAVAYTPLQEKRATVGEVLGNVLNKNFAIEFVGAASTTGITIDAQSWQLDYTARLETMDEIQRQAIKNIYGQGVFLNDGFKVEYNGTNYILKAGQACVGGLFIKLDTDQVIAPGALPQTVWLDVYQQKTMAGVQNVFDVTINGGSTLSDYTENGVAHSFYNVARIFSQSNISDYREIINSFEVYHSGNSVNPLDFGLGKNCINVNGTFESWDDIEKTGFYMGDALAQKPPGTAWIYVIHQNHSELYAYQTAYKLNNIEAGESNAFFIRRKNNGSWSDWAEVFSKDNFNPSDYSLNGHKHDYLHWENSHTKYFSQSYVPDDYFIQGEYVRLIKIKPLHNSRNYFLDVVVTASVGTATLVSRVGLTIRSNTLPDVHVGCSHFVESLSNLDVDILPVIWRDNVEGSIILAIKINQLTGNGLHNISADFRLIQRDDYDDHIILNDGYGGEVSTIPSGLQEIKSKEITTWNSDNFNPSDKANSSHSHEAGDLPAANTSAKGISKLNSSTNSDSETEAATPKAVKDVMEAANAAQTLAASKAPESHGHSISDISGLQAALNEAGKDEIESLWSGVLSGTNIQISESRIGTIIPGRYVICFDLSLGGGYLFAPVIDVFDRGASNTVDPDPGISLQYGGGYQSTYRFNLNNSGNFSLTVRNVYRIKRF